MLAACAARRWLARNAAGVKRVLSRTITDATTNVSLVSCLPALETVFLYLPPPLAPDDLRCLLEALAWCPHLSDLELRTLGGEDGCNVDQAGWPAPDMSAIAKLRSLAKLALAFNYADPFTLAHKVDGLVSLTGLRELACCWLRSPAVPAALGQLKGLRSLQLMGLGRSCVLEAGCFDLPKLLCLELVCCKLERANVLPGVTALRSLTRLEIFHGRGPRFFDHQLVQLPRLERMVLETSEPVQGGACPWLSRLPADMGTLSSTLLHLSFSGHGLTEFPLALTQLVALQHLDASRNEFAMVPAGITALSSLTELVLGLSARGEPRRLNRTRHLDARAVDARALGDLSSFPSLCRLRFESCEVVLCESMLRAVRCASLVSIAFHNSHPAPGCAQMVLQLHQALKRVGRGSVLSFLN